MPPTRMLAVAAAMQLPMPQPTGEAGAMRERWLVAVCALGTVCFVACIGIAIALYPGGTWFNRQATGHSFAENFLCDLMQTQALNGRPATVGAPIARFGTVTMFVALAAFFALVGGLESPVRYAGLIATRAGIVACVLGCAVPLAPSDRVRHAHVAAVLFAFAPALVATAAAFVVCLRAPVSRWVRASAVVTLAAGGLDGVAYAIAYAMAYGYLGSAKTSALLNMALPALQRVATVGLLAWVVAVCAHSIRGARRTGLSVVAD